MSVMITILFVVLMIRQNCVTFEGWKKSLLQVIVVVEVHEEAIIVRYFSLETLLDLVLLPVSLLS